MAVYTDITTDELSNLLTDYNIGSLEELTPIANGVSNSNYIITTNKNKYILTMLEDFSVGREALPFIVSFMQHLSNNGVPCPEPIKDNNGNIVKYYKEKPLLISSFISGHHPDIITPKHCKVLGNALAKLHITGQSFEQLRPNPRSVLKLIETKDIYLGYAEKFQTGLKDTLEKLFEHLLINYPKELPSGVIHADLWPDNVLFDADCEINGIIDFYLSGQDFLAFDLAICINAWCFDGNILNQNKLHSLISGYQKIRSLTEDEKSALQILHQAACLRFLLSRLQEWYEAPKDALVTPHDPTECIDKLKYHQTYNIKDMI